MCRFPCRFIVGVLLALMLGGGALAAPATLPAQAAVTWQVGAGGESPDHAVQAQAFFPGAVTIIAGDTVQWTTWADFVHTVTFLSGTQAPPVAAPDGADIAQPAATAFPSGGPAYDGTSFTNSGLLEGKGKTFALTFTKAGSFEYICLLHPGMGGLVDVLPAGSAAPLSQAQLDAQANAELYAKLSHGNQLLQAGKLTTKPNADGSTSYTVVDGAGSELASVLRFLPVDLTVKPGDKVTWLGDDPLEVHTVTFYDPAGKVPDFIVPVSQSSGPPKLVIPHAAPENGTTVDSLGLYNSGILGPGQAYTFSFPKPGVYTYVCVVHAPQGMFGKVIVTAAGAAPQPVTLPNTAEGSQPQIVLLLGGALLLLALGLLLRRRLANYC